MKKLTIILASTLLLGLSSSQLATASSISDFHSWNKPISPRMASPEEMKNYENDVDSYLKNIDKEIARLNAKKSSVISQYNAVATEYNSDQFFHKGTFKLKHMPRYYELKDKKDKDDAIIILNK